MTPISSFKYVSENACGQHANRDRGIVLILVLVGLIFIAALMAYVFNIGQQVQTRTKLQNAADAGAVSGPGAVARGFNTIAMNNVGIANLLGIVNNLDAMPRTVTNTRLDQEAVLLRLDEQLGTGIPDQLLRQVLLDLRNDVADEVRQLQGMEAVFAANDINAITHWDGGVAWTAMSALDSWSQAVASDIGAISQVAAVQAVEANLSRRVTSAGVMLPAEPAWPIERGTWADLEFPVRYGQLPSQSRMPVYRRGPYDTLYGWRDGFYQVELLEVPRGGPSGSGQGDSGWSGRGDQFGNDWQVLSHELLEYGTFGPHDAIQRHLSGTGDTLSIIDLREDEGPGGLDMATGLLYFRLRSPMSGTDRTPNLQVGQIVPSGTEGRLHSQLPWSRADNWHRELVDAKGRMLWGGLQTQFINEPDWITSHSLATNAGDQDPDSIQETCYVRVIIRTEYEDNRLVSGPMHTDTDIFWRRGYWPNPQGLSATDRVAQYIWLDEIQDSGIITGPNGQSVQALTLYQNYYVWIGANNGEDVQIDNPYEGFDAGSAPAPTDFIHEQRSPSLDGLPHDDLRFLTVAGQDTRSSLMPTRFDRNRSGVEASSGGAASGGRGAVAVSQSVVFNNHSDDLWTQMWRVQLEPVIEYENWVALMDDELPTLSAIPEVDAEATLWMHEQLEANTAASAVMLRH